MNTSDSYLLNSLAVKSFSKILRVISLLISMRSLRVCTRFLPRFVFKSTLSWMSLGDLKSSLLRVSSPDLRVLRSGSTRQFIGLCKFRIRLVYSSLSIQKQTNLYKMIFYLNLAFSCLLSWFSLLYIIRKEYLYFLPFKQIWKAH